MKKVVFLFEGNNNLKFIIKYFEKFYISNQKVYNFENASLIAGIRKDFDYDIINNQVKFYYNDVTIHLFNKIDEFNHSEFDKVFIFRTYHRGNEYKYNNDDKYEIILLNLGERTNLFDELDNELNNKKLISGSNISGNNIFYDYKLNLLYFYYYYGFDYLRYKFRKIQKQNLLGMYWFPAYKFERDNQVEKIQKLSNFNIDFYSEVNDIGIYELIRIFDRDNWDKNHISSWTDYETSVVGYVFETLHHSVEYESIHRLEYIGEKTLKPLIFSFLKMPFILDCNPYSFIDLSKDGYWFLNSEFFTYNENDDYKTLINNFSSSIDETIKYLSELNSKYEGDLEKISKYLYEKHSEKIDNNFVKIQKQMNTPTKGEELLNFILK